MLVAFSASGEGMDSDLDARFGRAPFFVVVETEDGGARTLDNSVNMEAGQGAGIKAAESLVREGVGAVITGHCGPKAFRVLDSSGIAIYLVPGGKIVDALHKFMQGDLVKLDSADSQGHW